MDKRLSSILLEVLWIFSYGVSIIVSESGSSRTYTGRFSPDATFMQSMFQTNMFKPSTNFMFFNRDSSVHHVDNSTKRGNATSLMPNLGITLNNLGQMNSNDAQNGFVGLPIVPGSATKQGGNSHVTNTFPDTLFEMIKPYEAKQTSWQKQISITEKLPFEYNNNGLYNSGQYLNNQHPLLNTHIQTNSSKPVVQQVFNGEPGMLGPGEQSRDSYGNFYNLQHQTLQEVRNISTIPQPVYNGFPGMLGAIPTVQQRHDVPHMSNGTFSTVHRDKNIGQDAESNATGNNRKDENWINANSNPILQTSNMLDGILPSLNTNNWNGEWPGHSSETNSSTDSWAKSWTLSSQDPKGRDEKLAAGQPAPDNGKQSSSWDGSWPDGTDNHQQTDGERNHDTRLKYSNIKESLDTLKKLMAKLDHLNSDDKNIKPNGGGRSYSDMVGDWAKDIRS